LEVGRRVRCEHRHDETGSARAPAVASLIALAVGPSAAALAEKPHLTIQAPPSGSITTDRTPEFKGTTDDRFVEFEEEAFDPVTLDISSASGPVQKLTVTASSPPFSGEWSVVAEPLADGSYTAQAEQTNVSETGKSEPVSFTVDTTPPLVTLTSPVNGSSSSSGSQPVGGSAGTASGDLPAIAIQLFEGDAIGAQAPLEALVVQAASGSWSATFGGLAPGSYTAQAAQSDEAGNTGASGPVTFAVIAPSAPPPPLASFKWFPAAPATGETVSLVSSSTDTASPITAFAWALSSTGPFSTGKPVLTTSFATPGGHVVRLRVTDAQGGSSIATKTVPVTGRPLVLMQPFPIVRIAGSVTSNGARVSLLTVQAPVAARITITCRGRGCKTKSESRLATISSKSKTKTDTVLLSFRRFERPLWAGVMLRILVSKPGQIGKYTRFVIRRHKLPARSDGCVNPSGSAPIACPSS
jgi:hypothetical protein